MSIGHIRTTEYFDKKRTEENKALIKDEWIEETYHSPEYRLQQKDGRYSHYSKIPEMKNQYLRLVLLRDGKTLREAYFVKSFSRRQGAGSWQKSPELKVQGQRYRFI